MKTLKIETTISYQKGFVPPRCRKMRFEDVYEKINCSIRIIEKANLKKAMDFLDYDDSELKTQNVYLHAGKYYMEASKTTVMANSTLDPFEQLKYVLKNCSSFYYNMSETKREDMINKLKAFQKKYFIDENNVLYVAVNKPCYRIVCFGLGNNHASTSLSISLGYRGDGRYFKAEDYQKAIDTAIEFAVNRGDTKSIKSIKSVSKINIY